MPFLGEEHLLPMQEAAKLLPLRRGRLVGYSTLMRWCTDGIRGIRLESIPVGGRRCTSREALQRFMKRLAAVDAKRRRATSKAAS